MSSRVDSPQHSQQLMHDLRSSVADLEVVNPWVGLLRFILLGTVVLGFVTLAWISYFVWQSAWGFVGCTAIAGVFYTFWLICTHDAAHHTLTGWRRFEEVISRIISWPLLWPYGAYAQLHRLHHGWNGVDLRDPERVQWTVQEYEQAHPILKWYIRHQWAIDILGLGGMPV